MNERWFYVYQFLREDSTPYYVGKGRGKRAFSHARERVIPPPKDRTRIIITHDNLTEPDAFQIEVLLIFLYGRVDKGTGILRNKTDGGEGSVGFKASPETRKLLSELRKGNKFGLGHKQTPEAVRKMLESRKNQPKRKSEFCERMRLQNLGRVRSEEYRKKMSEAKKGHSHPHTEESKRKLSESQKLAHARRKAGMGPLHPRLPKIIGQVKS